VALRESRRLQACEEQRARALKVAEDVEAFLDVLTQMIREIEE
jgi:hypothetical protein